VGGEIVGVLAIFKSFSRRESAERSIETLLILGTLIGMFYKLTERIEQERLEWEEERRILIEWVRKGAPEEDLDKKIMPIIKRRCASCHSQMPELDITKKEVLKKFTEVDKGISIKRLTLLSHVHLFGMSFLFMLIGFVFSFSIGINRVLKSVLIATPFVFQFIDILAWWLTKLWPWFAWFVIVGGFGYFLASGIMILISLYQMWFMEKKEQNAWLVD